MKTLDQYKTFVVTRATEVSEINATLIELIHEPTGAEILHIDAALMGKIQSNTYLVTKQG